MYAVNAPGPGYRCTSSGRAVTANELCEALLGIAWGLYILHPTPLDHLIQMTSNAIDWLGNAIYGEAYTLSLLVIPEIRERSGLSTIRNDTGELAGYHEIQRRKKCHHNISSASVEVLELGTIPTLAAR